LAPDWGTTEKSTRCLNVRRFGSHRQKAPGKKGERTGGGRPWPQIMQKGVVELRRQEPGQRWNPRQPGWAGGKKGLPRGGKTNPNLRSPSGNGRGVGLDKAALRKWDSVGNGNQGVARSQLHESKKVSTGSVHQ